jgi:hypothetical protein
MTSQLTCIEGGCHCRNIHIDLLWPQSEQSIAIRNCSCSFCRKHGGAWTSHRDAELVAAIDDWSRVSKYRFGTETADFTVCSVCGTVPFVACDIDGQLYAVINVNSFKDFKEFSLTRSASNFDGEERGDRIARRRRNWIPRLRIAAARRSGGPDS